MKHATRLLAIMLITLVTLAGCANARPKYVIVMISDGCSYNHIAASSLYQFGKPDGWAYQRFPVRLGMSTFPNGGSYDPALVWGDFEAVKKGATDSAAAATAMATGVKTYNGAIGVGPDKQPVQNILERAEELGMASGVVTSVPFCHATPAGFLAHNEGRGNYTDIAASMLASGAEVVMGAGHPLYDDSGKPHEAKYQYLGQPLFEQLLAGTYASDADGDGKLDPWKLVQTKTEFAALAKGKTPARVMGLAQVASTLQDGRGGDSKAPAFTVPLNENVPDLSQMTLAAFNVLDNNRKGFCVMIEGGAIDWAAHSNQSGRMIEEEIDFSKAVEAVIKWVETRSNWNDTLLIVTGDHETGYLTGPGSGPGPVWNPLVGNGKGQMPGMEWHYTSHTNSLLPLFAKGHAAMRLNTYPQSQDPRRGAYVDDTCVAKVVFDALK